MTTAPITALTPRKFSSWMAAYADYTGDTEAPAQFHMWTAVSTIAGALNRKCWIDMRTFQIFPSMYVIFVAPPGVATKSTTAGIGTSMLKETGAIDLAASSGSWQAMIDEMQESARVVTLEKGKPSVTISALQVFASELGTFLKLADGDQVDLLVDLWDGKPEFKRRLRSSGEIKIPRPYLNLLGCTTPAWLSKNAEDYFIGGGFFSRTIFVYADKKEKLIPYPDTSKDTNGLRKDLTHDLGVMSKMTGAFTLTDEAKAWGIEWYMETHTNTPLHLKGEKFQGYIARRQNHLHKVAMVISASSGNDQIITKDHMEIANGMLFMAEGDLKIIYDSIVSNDQVGSYKQVKRAISILKRSSKPALYRELAHKISYQDFETAVKALIFSQECKQMQSKGEIWLVWCAS